MPLYKTITEGSHVKILIWKVEETEDQLREGIALTENSVNRLKSMKSEIHRKGYLSIRHLFATVGLVDHDLYYDEAGKPHLTNGKYISITHSHEFTGIIVSDNVEVGVDIEMQREKILRIASKYTPLEEYKTVANYDALIRKLTIVWGAKESLYKIYSQHGLSFLHHIDITDFSLSDDSETKGNILYKGKSSEYTIKFLEFEGFTCVYAIKI
ncbi:4'-phosphopantetheinyl transferase superfamily protein [Arenibacter sp. 6A1]|uniref:4'-phosphopantetheinyl transferase family protein n=1 Tax=Arenibacter sp. 6A1 TaxID=2720391 RepID=UPI001444AA62|nr:4'-phosphopantetheinyl transferase family protein [Arenibacter sp. 6A1]NKI26196.1 4'-phosphopantetheinyl transferase superfamily protein [Arenibacter sp. 6A1]